ncbi:SGNH hydrolase-type esterase domain-containing protein [Jimgerdemannia flammicorona]|uniref:SGNH hydrolase-type esterase domain-containing protein n=1 Tax=Jimgerdemannia flammicorona TaxID=994334 RepID=A0A433DER7_9FUNG|nr:SGNH hydrolase-type esterase domain-containing protein [Jimgerdemannia flammicorona]
MEKFYYSTRQGSYNFTAWDFKAYTPDAVTIMLGENDLVSGKVPSAIFTSKYTTFLTKIRAKYPRAHIFALENNSKHFARETLAAVKARIAAGDGAVSFVDTTGWLGPSDFPPAGGVHPNDAGQLHFANLLGPIIKKTLGW